MKSAIADKMNLIESENDVEILYACESGSRAWGFDNPESDYDVRFIYRYNSLKDYLSLSKKPEVIELMDDDLDIVGWDIRKALLLHFNSNPNLREWTLSPIRYVDWKIEVFRNLPDFDRATLKYHYLNIAANNWKRLADGNAELTRRVVKMYMYNCRCILTWNLLDEGKNPPISIHELLDMSKGLEDGILGDIAELVAYYKGGCSGSPDLELVGRINRWMGENINVMRKDFPKKDKSRRLEDYDERLFEILNGSE
jgi:hypothetical protein